MEPDLGALRGVPLDVVDDRAALRKRVGTKFPLSKYRLGIDLPEERDRTGATERLRDVFR